MKILIISSTYFEIKEFIESKHFNKETENLYVSKNIDILISGIGTAYTIFRLTELLHNKEYDLLLNVGIAGSFNKDIDIGDVVYVETDNFADFGIDDNGIFKTLFDEKLIELNTLPFKNGELLLTDNILTCFSKLKRVKAITVNTTSGSLTKINNIISKYNPDIETMEGAAVAFVANYKNIKCVQIRAISNNIEPRNKNNWNIKLAIKNLNRLLSIC